MLLYPPSYPSPLQKDMSAERRESDSLVKVVIVGDATVEVLPVVLVPVGAPPCAAEAAPRTVVVPLGEPLRTRAVVVAPAGPEVPIPATR